MVKAIREKLLTDEHQKFLGDLLYEEFKPQAKKVERFTQTEVTQLTSKERKEVAAKILWFLSGTTLSQKSRFIPVAIQVWIADHKKQIIIPILSILTTILLVLAFFVIREGQKGQWHLEPLFAGPISAAAIPQDRSDIYVITEKGPNPGEAATLLWRQGNGDWKILSRSFIQLPVSSLLVTYSNNRPRIYTAVQARGILRSDDNGKSWRLINSGLLSYDIRVLIVDPLNSNIIYAGSGDKRGIFESRDGGDTWQDSEGDELFGASILSIVYTPFEGGLFLAGTDDGRILARKRDETIWKLNSAYPGIGAIDQMVAESQEGRYIYAGTRNGNVLISPDGGSGWVFTKRISGVFGINSIAVVPGKPNVVYMDTFGIESLEKVTVELSQKDLSKFFENRSFLRC